MCIYIINQIAIIYRKMGACMSTKTKAEKKLTKKKEIVLHGATLGEHDGDFDALEEMAKGVARDLKRRTEFQNQA